VWTGGLQLPILTDEDTIPPCENTLQRGYINVLPGANTTTDDDKAILCLNQPSKQGWGWYPIPTADALITAIFTGNGSGLVCQDGWCQIYMYPNGSLFELRPTPVVSPGGCTFCSVQFNQYGQATSFQSGNITLYNRTVSHDETIDQYTDSAIIMDGNSTFVNAGPSVLGDVLATNVNVSGTLRPLNTVIPTGGTVSREGCALSGSAVFTTGVSMFDTVTLSASSANCGYFTVTFATSMIWAPGVVIYVTLPWSATRTNRLTKAWLTDQNSWDIMLSASGITTSSVRFSLTNVGSSTLTGTSYAFIVAWEYERWA
jgi:hypothetical protein